MNLKIKYRESFRPFAPSVLRENVSDWFALETDSPYMLLVADVLPEHRRPMTDEEQKLFGIDKLNVKRSEIPGVTHVDYSARIQTGEKGRQPPLLGHHRCVWPPHRLSRDREYQFQCPWRTDRLHAEDSYRCFMRTEMDYLVLETCVLDKKEQPSFKDDQDWRSQFALD